MKIGIITTSFPQSKSDYVGAFIYQAARGLQRLGYQVKIVTIHSPGTPTHETWEGLEIYRTKYLPEAWELLKSEGGGLPEVWKKNPIARLQLIPFSIAFMVDVFIHTRDCEILHANWTLSGIISWIVCTFTRKSYVVTVHGSDIYRTRGWPFIIDITRPALRNAKKVIVVSQALAETVNSVGVPYSKIKVVPDGVDTRFFIPLPYEGRTNTILFVGSLIERKGVIYLIQAFSKVIEHFPNYKLILIGEGSQRAECEGLVKRLGLKENVSFTGAQSQASVAEAMRKAKILVLPSTEEGLGVVLLEALASGTPVVASNVGGISDVIDDNVGVRIPPADPDHLAKAILSILRLPVEGWMNLHQNSRKRACEDYDWDKIAQRLIEIYCG